MPEVKDIELTNEILERLKQIGALGFQIEGQFKYVPMAYRAKDKDGKFLLSQKYWAVFILRGIDGVDSAYLEDEQRSEMHYGSIEVGKDGKEKTMKDVSAKINSGKARIATLQRGIITWHNFRNTKGELIPAPKEDAVTGGITEDSLRPIPPNLQVELVNAITEQTLLTAEELLGLE